MADPDRHLWQARWNLQVLRDLVALEDANSHPARLQWAATVAFYTSVHLVEAWLWLNYKEGTKRHELRRQKLEDYAPDHIFTAHSRLEDWSRAARYNFGKIERRVINDLVIPRLNEVLEFVGEPPFS